jgi:hypothetical protein
VFRIQRRRTTVATTVRCRGTEKTTIGQPNCELPRRKVTTIERPCTVRLSNTRCGVEMYKTVECLTKLRQISNSTGPDECELFTDANRMKLARSEHHHGRATATDCRERDDAPSEPTGRANNVRESNTDIDGRRASVKNSDPTAQSHPLRSTPLSAAISKHV